MFKAVWRLIKSRIIQQLQRGDGLVCAATKTFENLKGSCQKLNLQVFSQQGMSPHASEDTINGKTAKKNINNYFCPREELGEGFLITSETSVSQKEIYEK